MEKINIGTFNLRNHYWKRIWDGDNFPEKLSQFIKEENITLLGTQELVRLYANNLQQHLGKNYTISGNYRYGKIPLIDQFNESNGIVTNEPVLSTETKYLATIPFFDHKTKMPRIMTSIKTSDYFMINTHIEYGNKTPQIYQLKLLYNYIINHINEHPIITGDFNMDTTMPHFVEFIKSLEKLRIQYVENTTPTYKTKEQILDHIFIPDIYNIEYIKVIQNQPINSISDHRPLLVKIRKK